MCGIGIDSMATVELMTDMGVRILKGEKVKDVKADYPPKALILLNQWTAYKLGYQFSPAALESAWRIYTDYKGTYVGNK